MATENVIIEFIADTTQLKPAIDQLEKMGKVEKDAADQFRTTNAQIAQQSNVIKLTADEFKKSGLTLDQLVAKVKKATSETSLLEGIEKSLREELQRVAASAKKFEDELGKSTGETKKLRSEVKTLNKELSDLKTNEQQNSNRIKELEEQLKKLSGTTGDTTEKTKSLKGQLRAMIASLAEMKVAGQDNTDQYRKLAQEAGHLKDAIGDANQEVKNFGSDTSTIDGVISLAQGLAGGFAVAQGAAALFGDESEELQKTLLKVNAVMAVLQGLQQVQIFLQKESAAATLANTIATRAQSAAQAIYNFVVGTSIGLTKALRIAIASTGVGLLVIAVIELVSAFKKSNDEIQKANSLLEIQKKLVEEYNKGVEEGAAIEEARARAAGKSQSDLIRIQGRTLQIQRAALIESNQTLAQQRDQLDQTSEAWGKLNSQILENNQTINGIDNQILTKRIDLEKQVAVEGLQAVVDLSQARLDAAKKNTAADFSLQRQLERDKAKLEIFSAGENAAKIVEINAALNKRLRDIDRAEREQRQKEILADIETPLLKAQAKSKAINERNTQEEIDLQKKLIITKARFEAQQEGLSQQQINAIKTKGILDAAKLQKDFNKQSNKEILEDFISRNNAELSKVELTEADKLAIIEDNIIAAAQIELDANEGISPKIKEINAKRDRDIKEARLASIQSTLEFELNAARVANAPQVRALEQSLADQERIRAAASEFEKKRVEKELGVKRLSLRQQIEMIQELSRIDSDAITKRIQALNEEKEKKLISEKDYNVQYEALVDDQNKIWEDAAKKRTDITIKENEERKRRNLQMIQDILDVATQVSGLLDSLGQLQSAKENQDIERRKKQIDELRAAGAITEKEAVARQKRLEADEKRIRQQQAQREKNVAVFNAAIAVPQAVLKGLTTGGPILAAIYGALALAQLLIVTSRPVPKFGKGKKDKYQGFGEVGEIGAELVQSNGKMWVATKPQIVWLGKDDKVFNPQETIDMLSHGSVNTERIVIPAAKNNGMKIDYDKFGKAVAKHVSTNVWVDGVQEQTIRQQEFIKWSTKRRAW